MTVGRSYKCREIAAAAFGLACMAAQPGASLITELQERLSKACHLPEASINDLAVLSWSLSIFGGLESELWSQVVKAVSARQCQQGYTLLITPRRGQMGVDEVAALFLLHTAMLLAGA
jgi:hypothetical protein